MEDYEKIDKLLYLDSPDLSYFTKSQKDILNKFFLEKKIFGTFKRLQSGLEVYVYGFDFSKKYNVEIEIYSVKDEWFYICIYRKLNEVTTYYKCDQFYGLIKCIEDNI